MKDTLTIVSRMAFCGYSLVAKIFNNFGHVEIWENFYPRSLLIVSKLDHINFDKKLEFGQLERI